jgi:dTDP-4-dehydrorhamnose reductase
MALKATAAQVEPVPTSAMPAAAQRPLNSRLDTSKLREAFGVELPRWEDGVSSAVRELARGGVAS